MKFTNTVFKSNPYLKPLKYKLIESFHLDINTSINKLKSKHVMEDLSKELILKYLQKFRIFKGLEIKVCSRHQRYRYAWPPLIVKLIKEYDEFFDDIFSHGPPTFDFIGVYGEPIKTHNINLMKIKRKCLIEVKSVRRDTEPIHFSKNQKFFSRVALKLGFEVYCIKVILNLENIKFKVYKIKD